MNDNLKDDSDYFENPGEVWLKEIFPRSYKGKFLPEDMIYAYNAGIIYANKANEFLMKEKKNK